MACWAHHQLSLRFSFLDFYHRLSSNAIFGLKASSFHSKLFQLSSLRDGLHSRFLSTGLNHHRLIIMFSPFPNNSHLFPYSPTINHSSYLLNQTPLKPLPVLKRDEWGGVFCFHTFQSRGELIDARQNSHGVHQSQTSQYSRATRLQ